MKTFFNTVIFAPILVFLYSGGCTKYENDFVSDKVPGNLLIQGQITTNSNTESIANMPIKAYWISDSRRVIRHKKSIFTDAQGNYKFHLFLRKDEAKDGYVQLVFPQIDDRFYFFSLGSGETSHFFFSRRLPRDTSLVVNYNLPSKVFLKVKFPEKLSLPSGNSFRLSYSHSGRTFYKNYDVLPDEDTLEMIENTKFQINAHIVNTSTNSDISTKQYQVDAIKYKEERAMDIIF